MHRGEVLLWASCDRAEGGNGQSDTHSPHPLVIQLSQAWGGEGRGLEEAKQHSAEDMDSLPSRF